MSTDRAHRLVSLVVSAFLAGPLIGCGSSSPGAAQATADASDDVSLDASVDTMATDAQPPPVDAAASILDQDPISVVSGSAHEHEPSIAVSPNGHVAVSFLSYVGTGSTIYTVGYRISNDYGATWGPATLNAEPTGDNIQANSSVAADDHDNVYMAWASESKTATGVRTGLHVFVAKAGPGETQFGPPIEITDPATRVEVYDLPRIAVTAGGAVIVTYMQVAPDGITTWLMGARSTDLHTWTRSIIAGPGSYNSYRNFSRICRPQGPGRIYLTYVESDLAFYENDVGVALRYSDDDGQTWSSPIAVQSPVDDALVAGWSTDCVTDGSNVWVLYTLTRDVALGGQVGGSPLMIGTLSGLRLAHSSDRGQTVDSRVDVIDPQAGGRAMYPVIVSEGNGALDLAYYTGRANNDTAAGLRRSRSADGRTFAPTVLVHQPLTLETSRTVPQWIGDYVGRAYAAGNLYLVYTDNAGAAPHIAFYRTPGELPPNMGEQDAGGSIDAGVVDAGPPGCNGYGTFTPYPWAPPTGFGQHACSQAQVQAYLACNTAGDCSAFRGDPANAGCMGCIETDVGASAHGPFVTEVQNGHVVVIETNYGGCQAHLDGQTGAGSCGNQMNDNNDCVTSDCHLCSDWSNPSIGGPTYECYFTATDLGGCLSHRVQTSCYDETLDGGVAAVCADPNAFLPSWCGP